MRLIRLHKSLHLTFIISLFSTFSFAQDSAYKEVVPGNLASNPNYLKADILLKEIEDSLQIDRANPISITGSYYRPFSENFEMKRKSKLAKIELEKCLKSLESGSSEYAKCLSKIALCIHFQSEEFVHSDSVTAIYRKSIKTINEAISIQKKNEVDDLFIQLNYVAAQIAIPHFYWGFQSMVAFQAEENAERYLFYIAEIQGIKKNYNAQVLALRLIDNQDFEHLNNKIEVAILAQEENPITLAHDIRDFVHEFAYKQDQIPDFKEKIEKYGPIGINAFEKSGFPDRHIYYYASLLSDLANCSFKLDQNYERAKQLLERAEEILIKANESTYYYAFQLAPIYIQEERFKEAIAQYTMCLEEEKLSVTDTEHAWLGLAVIAELQDDSKLADEIWKGYIGDTRIMNGVSSFQYWFSGEYKVIIKENALAVMKRNNATNAIRIVEESWE
jgi:tetratricopeptide (TPR) repeat protein